MESGSVTWVLMGAALVLFMTPGLAFFYGGMVRSKNVLNMLMMNFWCLLVVPLLWAIAGYSLAFNGSGSILGNLDKSMLRGLDFSTGEPAIMIFLATFAAITPGAHLRCRRRSDEVRRLGGVRAVVESDRLRAGHLLGVLGQRVAPDTRLVGLRRRYRHPRQRRRGRLGDDPAVGQAERLAREGVAAPTPCRS